MPSWWGKSSSKEVKKKANKESFIDTLHRRFKSPSDGKQSGRSGGSRRRCSDTISERGSQSRAESRSPSPTSKHVSRCQSFAERPQAQPLPLPGVHPASVGRTDSGIVTSTKTRLEKGGAKSSLFLPLPRPGCIRNRSNPSDLDGDLATASVFSTDCEDPADSSHRSPLATDHDLGTRTIASSPSSAIFKDHCATVSQVNSREAKKPASLSFGNHTSPTSPKRTPISSHVPNLQVPKHGSFCSAPDSYMSSPSRSPMRAFGAEQVINSAFWAGKPYPDINLLGSGHCSSPGSGYNSGHNSLGGDMSGQLFWQQSRGSPECSPIPSPRMTSPGPSSRVQSGAVTPIHPRAGGTIESQTSWLDDGRQQSHRLPLPPVTVSSPSPFSHSNSAAASPSVPRSPGMAENPTSPGSRWKKGKLLGRGTFGHVYSGLNSESGELCAMKEVTLFSDDAKSKESAKQLMQEISLLSRLQHPNIVQYYGSETVGDRLYIYLEYVSGGSIYKLLQEYGQLGELVIRSYTHQILSGLAFLHSKSTVHRDIKGANILVDPNGRVKLADFGMAKHITGQSCPLSFKGSPYWMAPEVIKNSNGCNLAVDIWSLGCTVLEMATAKPPWSQFEGVAAMFKIGNSKDLPAIPEDLSDEGKDFVRQCLQRNPLHRPTASQLLEHPFVKLAAPLERPVMCLNTTDPPPGVTNGVKTLVFPLFMMSFHFHQVGRTAGSLLGAILMVVFRVLTPDEAFAAIDLPILGLLFGTMVVSVYLERADMFKYLGKLLSWKSKGARDLLCRVSVISAISSALFTNDTSCVVLTEFILKITRQHNLPPHPFLLALASSANIGSSATPIGNPQNLVIAVQSKIAFGSFVFGILPAMLVGVVVNILILTCMYWKLLSSAQKDEEDATEEVVADGDVISHRFSPATMSHLTSLNSQEWNSRLDSVSMQSSPRMNGQVNHVETLRYRINSTENETHSDSSGVYESARNSSASKEITNDSSSQKRDETVSSMRIESMDRLGDLSSGDFATKWKRMLWKSCVYLVTTGMLIAFFLGLNMSWTALTAALALVVLDFKDAQPCLEKVSYSLLIFFCGMFITVDGFNKTGIPSALWDFMEPYARIDHTAGIVILALVILVLSNVASNVPTVLLLGGRVAVSAGAISAADEKKAWLILAWVSTVAGNLSLLGSAANLIVCEQAHRAPHFGYDLSFWKHLKFGVPSTIIITSFGLALIR